MGGGYCWGRFGCADYAPYSALANWDGDLRWRTRQDAEMFTRLGAACSRRCLFDIICALVSTDQSSILQSIAVITTR